MFSFPTPTKIPTLGDEQLQTVTQQLPRSIGSRHLRPSYAPRTLWTHHQHVLQQRYSYKMITQEERLTYVKPLPRML